MMKNTADGEFELLGRNVFSKIPVTKHGEKSLSKVSSCNSKGPVSMED